jgi:hypothetical protein
VFAAIPGGSPHKQQIRESAGPVAERNPVDTGAIPGECLTSTGWQWPGMAAGRR